MKRFLFLTIFYLLITFLCPSYSQSILNDWSFKKHRQYVKQAEAITYDNIAFEIERDFYIDGIKSYTHKYNINMIKNDKQYLIYCNMDSIFCFKLTNKQMKYIDHVNCELSMFDDVRNKNSFYNQVGIDDILSKTFTDIPYYVHYLEKIKVPIGCFFLISSRKDTIIDSRNYIIYKGYHDGYIYDDSTEHFDNYVRTDIYNIINSETKLLEYAYSTKNIDSCKYEIYTYIRNICFDKSVGCYEALFDDKLYPSYSFHNEKNPPYSRISSDDIINEELFNYPLISLQNDTVKFCNDNEWTLIYLWSLNCEPCIKQLYEFGCEKDSLGSHVLNDYGIKIYAVNYSSNNLSLINKIADKTNAEDIIYSAKGLNAHLNIPYLGYYYLISPDKKVVFKDYKLGDYSELLKAKEEYERNK